MNSLHSRCVSHAGDAERMLAIRSPFRKEEIHGPGGCEAKKQMRLIRRADGVSEAMMPNNANVERLLSGNLRVGNVSMPSVVAALRMAGWPVDLLAD